MGFAHRFSVARRGLQGVARRSRRSPACPPGRRPIAYGEVWTDSDENEAELARIIVAPEARGRGVGRRLVTLLVAEAERLGFDEIWLRVVPANAPAIASYTNAGFRRAEPDEEERFNRGQPREYVWMRRSSPSHWPDVA